VRYVTDFADMAVVLPLVIAVASILLVQGWRRGAWVWLVVVAGTFAATLGCKVIFLGCSPVFGPLLGHSPSGHVAAATVVAGGLAAFMTRRGSSVLPVAVVVALVIGLSRLVLGFHTLPEVIVGGLIGLTGAAMLRRFADPPVRLRVSPLVLAVVVVALVFHGLHMPAEAAIRHTAFRMTVWIPACRGSAWYQHLLAS
jgi:membrane-associated phospholipid phosphatase